MSCDINFHFYKKNYSLNPIQLNIVIIFPAVIGTLPGIELNAITSLIPILNVSLASKDIIAGVMNPVYMTEVYLSLFGFAALSLYWCVRSFNKESTIFRN